MKKTLAAQAFAPVEGFSALYDKMVKHLSFFGSTSRPVPCNLVFKLGLAGRTKT